MQTIVVSESTPTTTKGNNAVLNMGKRKIVNLEGEKCCKMKADPIMEKETLAAKVKREKQMERE